MSTGPNKYEGETIIPNQLGVPSNTFNDPQAFELTDILKKWHPTGYRVKLNMPYIPNRYTPIIAIAVNPYIPPTASELYNKYSPIFPLPITDTNIPPDGDPVQIVTYGEPPPISMITTAHKFWKGAINYRFRVVEGMFAQGYLACGVIHGANFLQPSNTTITLDNSIRQIHNMRQSYTRWLANSYIMSDLSMTRHVEAEVPYSLPYPLFDQRQYLNTIMGSATSVFKQPMDFLVLAARGSLIPSTGTKELIIEIEISAGADFAVFNEIGVDASLWNKGYASDPIIWPHHEAGKKLQAFKEQQKKYKEEALKVKAKADAEYKKNAKGNRVLAIDQEIAALKLERGSLTGNPAKDSKKGN